MNEFKDTENCARCNVKLIGWCRVYFGGCFINRNNFVSTCDNCYRYIQQELERARNECIEFIFRACDRSYTIQDGTYSKEQ